MLVVDADGRRHHLSEQPIDDPFWHTGRWQCWSLGCARVYFQGGDLVGPRAHRFDLASRELATAAFDMEGAPATGEPLLTSYHGMLYAAGYGNAESRMIPELSPVPFAACDRHGLFAVDFSGRKELVLSTAEVLERHPDRILAADRAPHDGLTLMCNCVRWDAGGERLLFYFRHPQIRLRRRKNSPPLSYLAWLDGPLMEGRPPGRP